MEVCWRSSWLLLLLGVSLLATTLQGVQGEVESEGPSESECRPYIEKALKELETGEGGDDTGTPDSKEDIPTVEITTDDSDHQDGDGDDDTNEANASTESIETDQNVTDEQHSEQQDDSQDQEASHEETADQDNNADDEKDKSKENAGGVSDEKDADASGENDDNKSDAEAGDDNTNEEKSAEVGVNDKSSNENDTKEQHSQEEESVETEHVENLDAQQSEEDKNDTHEDEKDSKEDDKNDTAEEEDDNKSADVTDEKSVEDNTPDEDDNDSKKVESGEKSGEDKDDNDTKEESGEKADGKEDDDGKKSSKEDDDNSVDQKESAEDSKAASKEDDKDGSEEDDKKESGEVDTKESDENHDADGESAPEEELGLDIEIPTELRDRSHVEHLLKLDDEASETEQIINRVAEITLRELKKLYENAIKPLEVLYKYRDLSNRHFGDAEIFSKPLILFMGPWSGGKSSIINYLLDNEFNETSLRTGAEPSPAYFNILMYGEEPEILDGTQLAADFTFSGLQKFGQGLEERLRGVKLPSKLLEKVNVVEIPGILEVRKQVSRVFPFNDACQWFIDRADIIFLVYDPSKLDVGPETEAILDQLKGREHQTRIILNKADQVKPEELMRVQGALIWNISPLMSSAQPPIMYTTSLWSRPYEPWAPVRLLQAQERAFLRDLRSAIDKRIEHKIASARRFAVRVRNHAKMVDCYLTTYYNHKSLFGNRKQVAEEIIEHPQDYHIYEGLSTLTNISRYDLPDPDVYKDFFHLNPLYEFQQLSATCTYFRGCPINRLDIAIAYDLPELVGKHKRLVEAALAEANQAPVPGS